MNKYIALIGKEDSSLVETLLHDERIDRVITLPKDEMIDTPISNHPDTILCIWNDRIYCHRSYYLKNKELLDSIGSIVPCDDIRNGLYPNDISYNVLIAGQYLIGKKEYLTDALQKVAVNTNQGYASCTAQYICNTIISADRSILKVAESLNINTYLISGEDIILDGYNTGFVGGATGVLENTLFIYGDSGKSVNELKTFASKNNINTICLTSGVLEDIGGIKFVKHFTN